MVRKKYTPLIILPAICICLVAVLVWPKKKALAPTVNTTTVTNTVQPVVNTNSAPTSSVITFSTVDVPERDPAFDFSMQLPDTWLVEYQPTPKAINVYAPKGTGTRLGQSTVFIQYYTGTTFQFPARTLATTKKSFVSSEQSVSSYTEKAVTTVVPTNYPTWWSQQHEVIDVRSGSSAPYTFFVLHFAPTLDSATIQQLSNSFHNGLYAQPM